MIFKSDDIHNTEMPDKEYFKRYARQLAEESVAKFKKELDMME